MSERYQTLKRIRWPSTQPLIYNKEGDEWVLTNSNCSNSDLISSSNDLKDVEIVGHSEHVEKLRRIFADSAATVIEEPNSPQPQSPQPPQPPQPATTSNKLSRSTELPKPTGSPIPSLRASSLTPNPQRIDSTVNKSPLFQSLSNIYAYSPTDEGESSDSEEESVIQHRRHHSETSACGLSPEVQNRRDIIRVQNRIINLGDKSLITPTRLYIKEGEFTKVGSKNKTAFFLFDDLLIIGKLVDVRPSIQGTTRVKFRKALDLRCVDVQAVPDNKANKHLLVIKYYSSKNLHLNKWRRTYSAPSKQQRDEWFADLCALREKLTKGSTKASMAAVRTLSSPRLMVY